MKHRISIAVDKDDNQSPNSAGIPISGLVNDEANRIKTEVWKKENREGMENVAKFIAQNSSFADENRNW
ncbi:type II toxin-antitoxin system antitoxin CcdA [Pectobacterium versatile]|uniref:Antitoxin CcdA n=1 Tax=Pectobacterium versatile TaxID=2488639 RepID=A0A855MCY4_9GAMM|nr:MULTISPECIES: type II toxin-antitoxin system antitoxin CcdA [Pectobacterium]AVT57611.1 antitoxin CcdA [Pectobacterium versatile]MBQ4780978.1 type II toxin-antitoxin system antitoxin CcdA [Pectobacterium versatile]MBQ4785535.1 type II toxin-antitoxin system antitoxin CcdA [Pectobacterium versatile]MBQ4788405.1 type II toxin-antitoxin system antitoxin CcdA [Pectobacterium versatile]MBQ4794276.1 type II toxin-antitoxin system antitoxin CcdA [Pectobacterium versatile]